MAIDAEDLAEVIDSILWMETGPLGIERPVNDELSPLAMAIAEAVVMYLEDEDLPR